MIGEKEDALTLRCADAEDAASVLVALAKEVDVTREQVVYVDDDGNDAVQEVYGSYPYTWKSSDTLDAVAYKHLHDASMATVIAYYNGIQDEAAISAGSTIRIPIVQQRQRDARNRIYADSAMRDSYGTDIRIDDAGGFAVSASGDFATTGGSANLDQAIAHRLVSAATSRIRLISYGIKAQTGDTQAVESYLAASIEQTLLADPRIKRIDSLSLRGDGDKLYIDIVYTDINEAENEFQGQI